MLQTVKMIEFILVLGVLRSGHGGTQSSCPLPRLAKRPPGPPMLCLTRLLHCDPSAFRTASFADSAPNLPAAGGTEFFSCAVVDPPVGGFKVTTSLVIPPPVLSGFELNDTTHQLPAC